MATQLIKLPGAKWWIEYDDVNNAILNTYNKTAITADILAINNTLALAQYPKPTVVDTDVAAIIAQIPAGWTAERKARVAALIQSMYAAYQSGDALYIEAAQLIAKRDALIELKARLV
ncbi:MAG: hypothetical protein ACYC6L_04725 [Anaerolineae bacterium]